MYFEIYQSTIFHAVTGDPQWRWRLRAANHETIASGESYTRKEHCLEAIALLMGVDSDTPIVIK